MTTTRRWALAWVLLTLGAAGCGGDAPEPRTALPGVVLEIERDGVTTTIAPPASLAPSFTDGGHRAWRLEDVFGADAARGARFAVQQADGTRTLLPAQGAGGSGAVWVLRANRRGEAQVAQIDPADPFPAHHGRGGSQGRQGTPTGRLRDVVRIRMIVGSRTSEPPGADAERRRQENAMLKLEVLIDGTARTLDAETLAELDPIEVGGDDGKSTRDAWSVRALVRALAGPSGRLTVVHGRDGRALELDEGAWGAAERAPVLRLNRRGQLKFHWAGADGKPLAGDTLRDVTKLEIRTD